MARFFVEFSLVANPNAVILPPSKWQKNPRSNQRVRRNIPWMMPSTIASNWKKWQTTRCLTIQLKKWARQVASNGCTVGGAIVKREVDGTASDQSTDVLFGESW